MLTARFNGKEIQLAQQDGLWVPEGIHQVDIHPISDRRFHLIANNRSYDVEVLLMSAAEKRVTLNINNRIVEVELSDAFDRLLHDLGMDKAVSHKVNNIKAPMPGLVLRIEVEEGAELAPGDKVLVLEAMKMENVIKSPGSGKVKQILVKPGTPVEKNQVLVELE
jgi:biotin carboxyl carrier protein